MYTDFFGLRELPFNNSPDPRFFFSTPDHEEALASLVYAVQSRKGFVLLTGEVGAGKTLVSRMMLRHFGSDITFATINHAIQSAGDLMESVCAEFEIPFDPSASNAQLVRRLHDFLLNRFAQDTSAVLVLDEAQTVPVEAFEQLRMIGNLEADDAKLLQIVILGQPELQHRFASPELRQLRQRIFRVFHLSAMDRDTTEGYIRHRLKIAGAANQRVFDNAAIDVVHEHSQGLPRLINTLCDNAMLSAYSADQIRIDAPLVETVVAQMMTLRGSPVGGPTAAPGYTPPAWSAASEPVRPWESTIWESRRQGLETPGVSDPLASFKQEVAAEVARMGRRVAALEHDHTGLRDTLDHARAVRDRLVPLLGGSAETIARVESGKAELAEQQARAQLLASRIKAIVEESRRILDGIRRIADRNRRAEHAARDVSERLEAQIQRLRDQGGSATPDQGGNGSAGIDRSSGGDNRSSGNGNGSSGSGDQLTSGLLREASRLVSKFGTDPNALRGVLQESRKSVADFRSVARSRPVPPDPDQRAADLDGTQFEEVAVDQPAVRLSREVESLVDLVSPNT